MTALDEIRARDALIGDDTAGATLTQAEADRRVLLRFADVFTAAVGLLAEKITDGPTADWSSTWAELTGYVQQAKDDGGQIDPADLLAYMSELKRKALAPVRAWMAAIGKPARDDGSTGAGR